MRVRPRSKGVVVIMKMVSKGHTTFWRKHIEGLKIFMVHAEGEEKGMGKSGEWRKRFYSDCFD